MRVLNYIITYCYNATANDMEVGGKYNKIDARDTPYRFSDVHNKFTVIGCNTLAYIFDSDNDTILQRGAFQHAVSCQWPTAPSPARATVRR